MNGVSCPDAAVRARVASMAGIGMPAFQIAFVIRVSLPTLQGFYGEVMLAAQVRQNCAVLETLARMARSGRSVAATLFWAKTRCGFGVAPAGADHSADGQATTTTVVITGPNGERA